MYLILIATQLILNTRLFNAYLIYEINQIKMFFSVYLIFWNSTHNLSVVLFSLRLKRSFEVILERHCTV